MDEICNDNSDNNGNELVDCEEEDCTGSLCDGTNINICIDDGIDNDEDEGLENGGTDCENTDCDFDDFCETGNDECSDTLDNDNDGDMNCADRGCDFFIGRDDEVPAFCEFGFEFTCDDFFDNDADGFVDCDDSDCQFSQFCGQ